MVYALSLFYYYFGPYRAIALFSYLLCVPSLLKDMKVRPIELAVVFYILFDYLYKAVRFEDLFVPLFYQRLYWGYIVFYFFFKANKNRDLGTLMMLASALTLLEYLLMQVYPGLAFVLPNYDSSFLPQLARGALGGVYSFGGNRTVSGVLLLGIYIYFDRLGDRRRWFPLAASLVCFSGTAMLLLVAYLSFRYRSMYISPIILALGFAAVALLGDLIPKISWEYIVDIFGIKTLQWQDMVENYLTDWLTWSFGSAASGAASAEVEGYSQIYGDFLLLDFLVRFGVLGIVVLLTFAAGCMNRRNAPMLIILLVGSLQYHVIFSLPGQLFFGFFLAYGVSPILEDSTAKKSPSPNAEGL